MAGTVISGAHLTGIILTNPATQNPATITATGKVSNTGVALFGKAGTAWTVSNFGTVEGTGTAGGGIYLTAGGRVTNNPSGFISGFIDAVCISHATGAVLNSATIEGTGTAGSGIYLTAGGSVTNNPHGLISGFLNGVAVGHAVGAVVNSGTIEATGTDGGGIYLTDGGSITNRGGGLVTGVVRGITVGHSAGHVENLGRITGTGTSGGGIWLISGGSVINGASGSTAAVIEGAGTAIAIGGTAGGIGTVTNFGTIKATAGEGVLLFAGGTASNFGAIKAIGTDSTGIALTHGGSVINGSSAWTKALIAGGPGGVNVSGGAGVVANYGTIDASGTTGTGIALNFGGRVTNGSSVSTTALIEGGNGISVAGATGAVTNFGTIKATTDQGIVLTASGTIGNFGTIESIGTNSAGVFLESGGSVTNGSSGATGSLIESAWVGVGIRGAVGTIANFGTIISTTTTNKGGAVWSAKGGVVTNGAGGSTAALITSKRFGVYIGGSGGTHYAGAVGTVTNFGTIETTGKYSAVVLVAGGAVRNFGSINGYRGVQFAVAAGTVTNYGTIKATTKSGIALGAGGTVANHGLVAGGSYGIGFGTTASAGTVVNSGTSTGKIGVGAVAGNTAGNALTNSGRIVGTGGTAVAFGGGNDVLTVEPGAVFVGAVIGGKGTDKVIEGAPGALNVTGFSGFEIIALANGGADSLTLGNANFAGVTGASITIDGGNAGNTVNAAALTGSNRIVAVGGAGKDVFTGGAGNDFFNFTEANLAATDIVKGGDGSDTLVVTTPGIVQAAGVSGVETYRLANGGTDTLTLTNGNFIDVSGLSVSPGASPTITVYDGNSGNTVSAAGVAASDRIVVHAGAGIDKLTGGAGNDTFYAVRDTTMTGGAGANVFGLTAVGTTAAPVHNTITDFAAKAAANDIWFSDAAFGLTGTGPLPPGLFTKNPTGAFTATSQRFGYNTTNGDLYYSASGTTATRDLIVTLSGHPTLSVTQLLHG